MTIDIDYFILNSKISNNKYVIFETLILDSIDAFLARKEIDRFVGGMLVEIDIDIEIDFTEGNIFGDRENLEITCKNNGMCLRIDRVESFLDANRSLKDDDLVLKMKKRINAGRAQFFHNFSNLSIASNYYEEKFNIKREIRYCSPQKHIYLDKFRDKSEIIDETFTITTLTKIKENTRNEFLQENSFINLFSAPILKAQTLKNLSPILIEFIDKIGNFEITFITSHWKEGKKVEILSYFDLATP